MIVVLLRRQIIGAVRKIRKDLSIDFFHCLRSGRGRGTARCAVLALPERVTEGD
jgi:hypothetical protein